MNDIIITEKEDVKEESIAETKEETKEDKIMKNVFINSFIISDSLIEDIKIKEDNDKDKNKDKNDDKDKIILINNDIRNESRTGSIFKNKSKKYEDIYNYRKQLNISKKVRKFHLFNCECKNPSEDKIIYKLGKILLFTYRKNFPKITNFKTKKTYTTDAWWGCMLRCAQMILSRGIYLSLKSKGLDTKNALYYTVCLFNGYPITKDQLHPFFHGMLEKYKNNFGNENNEIKEFFPPFCLKTLCDVGEIYERTAGEWFSDVISTNIFKRISEYFNLFSSPNLDIKILTFQSYIEMQDILNTCFIEKKKEKGNEEYIHLNGKYYYFNKMGLVFVNVRVGLDKIPPEYFRGIRNLFALKSCIGIIGGKTRLAYYFIGYNDEQNSLLYLDPHITKDSDKEVTMFSILGKHINKEIHLLKMNKMSTAFTIGFCFRKYNEFLELFGFWQQVKQDKLKILGLAKQNVNYAPPKDNDEDFSPTYDDKDEDDF